MSTERSFLGASPDGVIHCSCCGKGVFEIKCTFLLKEAHISSACDVKKVHISEHQTGGLHMPSKNAFVIPVLLQRHTKVTAATHCGACVKATDIYASFHLSCECQYPKVFF